MSDDFAEVRQIPVATHSYEQRYLFAFATQSEVANHIRTQALDEERERLPEVLEQWNQLQTRVQSLVAEEEGISSTIEASDIPAELHSKLNEFASDSLFQKTFSQIPISFSMVEIDKLVAAQRTVNLDYVARLSSSYPRSPTPDDLLDICVSPTRDMDPIQHLEVGPNTHVFSSPNSDIRFLGAFTKQLVSDDLRYAVRGGIPAAAVIAFVGYTGTVGHDPFLLLFGQ